MSHVTLLHHLDPSSLFPCYLPHHYRQVRDPSILYLTFTSTFNFIFTHTFGAFFLKCLANFPFQKRLWVYFYLNRSPYTFKITISNFRYVAIRRPLGYASIMTPCTCIVLIATTWASLLLYNLGTFFTSYHFVPKFKFLVGFVKT